jgi:hypothetical protein
MHEITTVFLFQSSDGVTLGLSTLENGSNLPRLPAGSLWKRRLTTPMTVADLAPYVRDPHLAMTSLIMRGFHLARLSGDTIAFPKQPRAQS